MSHDNGGLFFFVCLFIINTMNSIIQTGFKFKSGPKILSAVFNRENTMKKRRIYLFVSLFIEKKLPVFAWTND